MLNSKYGNLWVIPRDEESIASTDNVIPLMREQCQFLKLNSNGKIFGKFDKLKKLYAFETIAASLNATTNKSILGDGETANLSDANSLYNDKNYGFEIYNATYRYRLFELKLSPVYPITISFDEGILDDTTDSILEYSTQGVRSNQFIVECDDNLMACFGAALESRKVRYILYKLQQGSDK